MRSWLVAPLSAWMLLVVALVCPAWNATALAQGGGDVGRPTPSAAAPLTDIREVLRLPPDEAARGYRVVLRGVVTFVQVSTLDFFMQSGEHAIWVSSVSGARLSRGDLVEVRGATNAGVFAPDIHPDPDGVSVVGQDSLPLPAAPEELAFANGEHDCRFIALSGVVRLVAKEPLHVQVTMATSFGRVAVLIPTESAASVTDDLVGARVSARGVCAMRLNERGQMTGMRLYSQEGADLQVIAPARPVATLPWVSPARLLTYRAVADPSGRTRTKGVVTLRRGDGSFFIAGDGAAAFVRPTAPAEVQVGDEVEVIGFARADDAMTTIEDAILTRGPSGPRPFARTVPTAAALASSVAGGELVRIETEVFRITQRERETILSARMEDGQGIVELRLTADEAQKLGPEIEVGARVAFTGVKWPVVSAMLGDKWPLLLVDGARDVELLAGAPWLNRNRALLMVVIVALAGLAVALASRWRLAQKERVQAQLEAAVAERTAELEAASRRLGAFDAIRSRFVALANHELRSPLMVVRMRGELLGRDASPTTRVHGNDIVRCADQIAGIINEFLEKPLDQGQPRIATDRVNLSDLARAAVARAEPMLRTKGQRMVLEGTVRGVPAWGDARLIGAVLDNLLSNASKFAASNTEVRVSVRQNEDGSISSVSVVDQGPGLSESDKARLFRRGVMLSARPTAGESSEGNGLALAHELTVAMAGRIVCESALGAGAEFRMELPGDAGPPRPWNGA